MNYELAKKLYDAGFQKFWGTFALPDTPEKYRKHWYPSLSELIEVCGDRFVGLFRVIIDGGIYWRARGKKQIIVIGNSPEESVANLWLALQEKSKIEEF